MTQPLLAAFFRRSAQRFFISSDKRRLPAAVRPRRRRVRTAVRPLVLPALFDTPSSAAIA